MLLSNPSSNRSSATASKEALLVNDLTTLLSSALNLSGSGVREPLHASTEKIHQLFHPSLCTYKCLRVPSLLLNKGTMDSVPQTSSRPFLADVAANNLKVPVEVTRDELRDVPIKLLWNLSKSLMFLVDSRLRSSVLALVESSSAQGLNMPLDHPMIGQLLSNPIPIVPTTIVTTFQTSSFPKWIENDKYVAPVTMDAVVDLNVFGSQNTIRLQSQGTIVAAVSTTTIEHIELSLIYGAEMQIDTAVLVSSLIEQSKVLVRKAITIASLTVSSNASVPSIMSVLQDPRQQQQYGFPSPSPDLSNPEPRGLQGLTMESTHDLGRSPLDCESDRPKTLDPTAAFMTSGSEPADKRNVQALHLHGQSQEGEHLSQPSSQTSVVAPRYSHMNKLDMLTAALSGIPRETSTPQQNENNRADHEHNEVTNNEPQNPGSVPPTLVGGSAREGEQFQSIERRALQEQQQTSPGIHEPTEQDNSQDEQKLDSMDTETEGNSDES